MAQLTNIVEYPRKCGDAQHDQTAYHPEQQGWGSNRKAHWPYMENGLLFRLECKNYPVPTYSVGSWIHNDQIVLDADNHPVRNFRNLPATISSKVEPWLMEMWIRQDTRITHRDLRARMPTAEGTAPGSIKSLISLSAVAMRLTRFREREGIPAWKNREGSDKRKDYIMNTLSEDGLQKNSTKELDGLTKLQQEQCRRANKGKFQSRAGARAISSEQREKREAADMRRMARLQAEETGHNSAGFIQP